MKKRGEMPKKKKKKTATHGHQKPCLPTLRARGHWRTIKKEKRAKGGKGGGPFGGRGGGNS